MTTFLFGVVWVGLIVVLAATIVLWAWPAVGETVDRWLHHDNPLDEGDVTLHIYSSHARTVKAQEFARDRQPQEWFA